MESYGFLGVYIAVIAIVAPIPLILAFFLRPKKSLPIKEVTYECGLQYETFQPHEQRVWGQFRVQYYLYALIFVIFDVETVFLFPWAAAYGQLGLFALIEVFIFVAILFTGLVYAWRKGALEW